VYVHDVFEDDVTLTEVAKAWGMAPATLRKYSRELVEALKPAPVDPRYISLMDPLVRLEWRRNCLDILGDLDWEDEGDRDAEGDELVTLSSSDGMLMERALRGAARELMGERPAGPIRDAEELIDQAWEASGSKRTRLAEQALRRWPDAADAYVILGQSAQDRGNLREAVRQFEAGVKAGARALGAEFFAENAGHFYGLVESRPYMRARAGLATCLWALDERKAAVAHYEEMLRLNPGDNQGIRYLLASCYLMMGADARLGSLLAEHADEPTAAIGFTRALWEYRRSGPGPAANKLLAEATAENPYVAAYLLGRKRLPAEPPAYVDCGGPSEAQGYAWNFGEGWKATPGALDWLRSRTR
jgi:tetratricopeptide (TPR) repeat protein